MMLVSNAKYAELNGPKIAGISIEFSFSLDNRIPTIIVQFD